MQVCWNPFSRKQTRRAVKLMDHLLVFVPADHPKMQVCTLLCNLNCGHVVAHACVILLSLTEQKSGSHVLLGPALTTRQC